MVLRETIPKNFTKGACPGPPYRSVPWVYMSENGHHFPCILEGKTICDKVVFGETGAGTVLEPGKCL